MSDGWTCGAVATGAGAGAAVRVPEPMVFDRVRGLGADKGELEANALALVPLNDTGVRDVAWAPEVEFAVVDGDRVESRVQVRGSVPGPVCRVSGGGRR